MTQKLIFLVLFALMVGCSSLPSKDEACTSTRGPSSLRCEHIFLSDNSVALTIEAQNVIARVPEYFENLQRMHGFDYTKLSDYTLDLTSTNTSYLIAESLYNDYMAGSPAGPVFLKLGHRFEQIPAMEKGKTINVLRPNLNLSEIYQKIYSLVLPKAGEQNKIEDLILQALLFTRKNPENGKKEITMSRPGIDPIPDPAHGWKLNSQALLDLPTFALNLSQGKIPLEHKMYHHDLAHSVDYILSPHLTKWYKRYHKAIYERSLLYGVKADLNLATEYLHEFSMFPKLEKRNALLKLIQAQNPIRSGKENRLAELTDQLASGELSRRIEVLHQQFYHLFEVHGGGMLDGISHHKFGDIPNVVLQMAQRGYLSVPQPTVPSYVGRDSFWGMVQQMALINEVMSSRRNKSDAANHVIYNLGNSETKLPLLLVELMKKFEDKVEASLRFEMSAENLFRDIFSPDFKKTSSYNYFRSTTHPNSLEYHVFVKENYLPKP